MEEEEKTKEQLIEELDGARQRLSEIEGSHVELLRVKKALQKGVEALGLFLENSNDILAILLPDGTLGYVSPSAETTTGYHIEDMGGRSIFDLIHPDDAANLRREFETGLESPGRAINLEVRYRHADGSWRIVEAHGINLTDNPLVSGMVFTARDITDRKTVEQALAERERYMRTLVENTLDIILVLNRNREFTFISPSVEHVVGYNTEEFMWQDPLQYFEIIHPDDRQKVAAFIDKSQHRPGLSEAIEYRVRHADGTELTIEARANNLLDDPVIEGVVHTLRDITERRRSEDIITARERYYRSLIRNAADMVSVLDENLFFKWGSPSASRITGYGLDDVYGKSILDFLHPDDLEKARRDYMHILQNPGAIMPGQRRFRHKDGTYHWHEAILTNLLDDPSVQGIIVNSRDITERKIIEEELLASNRELDAFATSVSHDLRSPLSLIEGYAQLMRSEENTEEENEAYLKSIITAARRMDELTESLLGYAQAGKADGAAGPVEPLDVVSDILFEHSVEIESRGIDVVLGEEFPTLSVDQYKLRQVLANLVNNAVKYLADTPQPRIEIASPKRDGKTATFYIRDNGPGLEPGMKEEAFLPFKRSGASKPPGLGIGLSTVKRAVEGWGGRVWIDSEPGKGATFYFTAPMA